MAKQKKNSSWIQSDFFLIVPKPQEDELLSSWLTRMAFAHKKRLPSFLNLFVKQKGYEISRIDIDFKYNQQLIDNLSIKSGLSKKTIFNMSLRSEEGYLFICDDCLYPPKQIRKLQDKRTHNGLMFCPKCLAEDEIPYWRKQWRYHFYNACPKHKVFLVDRCWSCYKRIKFSQMTSLTEMVFCHNCGMDLRLTRVPKLESYCLYGLKAIKWFEDGLKNGYFIINNKKINSVWIFHGMTRFYWKLDSGEKLVLNGFPLLEEYKRICRKLKRYSSKKTSLIHKSFFLNAMVYHIFQDYPKNFLTFIEDNKLTHRTFNHGVKNSSFWYKNVIADLVPIKNTLGRKITEKEVIEAIKYLKAIDVHITQLEVGRILGCHFSINKNFVEIYKSL